LSRLSAGQYVRPEVIDVLGLEDVAPWRHTIVLAVGYRINEARVIIIQLGITPIAAIPALLGDRFTRNSGAIRAARAEVHLAVIASQRVAPNARPMTSSAKQSILSSRLHGLLRYARNDDLKPLCVLAV
jgi:hypothetical protein